MFLRITHKIKSSLAVRLTVWYAGIFIVFSIVAFTFLYFLIAATLQTQIDDDLKDDIHEFSVLLRTGGLAQVKHEMLLETQNKEAQQDFYRLWTLDGELLATSDLSTWSGLAEPVKILVQLRHSDEPILETLEFEQHEFSARSITALIDPNTVLQVGESLADNETFLAVLLNGFLITLATIILLGGPIGWFMAKRALLGIQEITEAACLITNGAIEQRVAVRSHGHELDQLAQAFNTMLDRIQTLIVSMREMTDNLAHDLRSPLGHIRAAAEITLTDSKSCPEMETLATAITKECDRLLEMINTTLDIAEAESGTGQSKLDEIDLVAVINDAQELFQPIAEDKNITVKSNLPKQCFIVGDRRRLQRVVANLLDNALKYTSPGGQVDLKLNDKYNQVQLSIEDNGMGISKDETIRIFERFYRCDKSRTHEGNGLGLSLAQAFVRAHGGNINIDSTLGEGSIFTVTLFRNGILNTQSV